ncbi:hypothetical protein ABTI69_20995, partial [Acinetobacter baumannii]
DFLYPIAVSVSAITTLLTPYLIRGSDTVVTGMGKAMPGRLKSSLMAYTDWVNSIGPSAEQAQITAIIRRVVVHVVLNFCVIAAIFIA